MLKNYIKIAYRNILRNKTYGFINISGMAVGLSVFFLISLYVLHELSYDRFIPDADRVVRIVQKSDPGYMASTPPGLAPALKREMPGIESLTLFDSPRRELIGIENEYRYVNGLVWADRDFQDLFPFNVLHGSGSEILEEPGKMILTQSAVYDLFGAENPIGKTVQLQSAMLEDELDFEVAGIIEDPPVNLHFSFKALLSSPEPYRQFHYGDVIRWNVFGNYIYARLTEGTTLDALQQQLTHFEQKLKKPENISDQNRLTAQALTDIHLARDGGNEFADQGNRTYILLFSIVGLLILGIAGFNYMNLSVAQSFARTNEVGIRKVSGASRKELVYQFLGESLVISLLSLPLALVLLEMFSPEITGILDIELAYTLTDYPQLLFVALGLTIVVGLIAGSYPAFVLSSMKPAGILTNWGEDTRKSGTRKVLVIMQFAISIILLIATLVILQQMQYVQQKQLGFESENILTFTTGHLEDQYPVFKQELLRSPQVVSVSSGPPMGIGHKNMAVPIEDPETGENRFLSVMNTDYDYIGLMGISLIAGRDFSPERSADIENFIIVNESAARLIDPDGESLGKTITVSGVDKEIIGVVEDFHNESLYSEIAPVVFQLRPQNNWTGLVKLAPGNLADGIEQVEAVWNQFLQARPFEFTFLDDRIDALYRQEQRIGMLFFLFSGIAIIIAGLGLFGLAAFITTTRTKEIGIRKVMGATVVNIIVLLNKDFLKLVFIGFVIAVPIAWYSMNQWLQDFAYRIEIGRGIFAIAGGAALLIALTTVSWQSIKAALMNPADSLKNE